MSNTQQKDISITEAVEIDTGITLSVDRYNTLIGIEQRLKDWKYGYDKSDEYKTLIQMIALGLVAHLGDDKDTRLYKEIAVESKYQEAALTALTVALGSVIKPLVLPSLIKMANNVNEANTENFASYES